MTYCTDVIAWKFGCGVDLDSKEKLCCFLLVVLLVREMLLSSPIYLMCYERLLLNFPNYVTTKKTIVDLLQIFYMLGETFVEFSKLCY